MQRMSEPTACPNCATRLQGRYCRACGQKRIEPEEQRFGWFLRQMQVAYAQPGWLALAKLLLLLGGLVAAHLVDRAVQFFVAFALS
jgi:hypothetical protein